MVGDEHHGDALLPVQLMNGGKHLLPPDGVQHGGGLVQHDALRLHGDDAGDGDPLLLTAGQQMGRMGHKGGHIHGGQGIVHPAADLL